MTQETPLTTFLESRRIPETLDRDWLIGSVLAPLGIEEGNYLADLCEDIVLSAADDESGQLQLRPGGWVINLSSSLIKTTVAAAIVGASLATIGASQIPLALLPAVLPLLVDMKRVKLNAADRELLLPLRHATVGLEGMAVHPRLLYGRLDPSVQAQLNYYDSSATSNASSRPARSTTLVWTRCALGSPGSPPGSASPGSEHPQRRREEAQGQPQSNSERPRKVLSLRQPGSSRIDLGHCSPPSIWIGGVFLLT